jgi:hypothetical protein
MLALDQSAFDQDPEGGWRQIASRNGCKAEAADLIALYRERQKSRSPILYWHEGQLRASLGQTAAAIALFEMSRKPKDMLGWNAYVDASIAFLKNDKEALVEARERLLSTPKPTGRPLMDTGEVDQMANEHRCGGCASCVFRACLQRSLW